MGKRVSKLRKKQKVYSKILSKVGGVESGRVEKEGVE